MNSQAFDHLFYLRLTEACNLYCDHCFIPNNPKKIKKQQLPEFIRLILDKSRPGDTILVQFHGGEPTIVGADNLVWWAENIQNAISDRILKFRIQTNLYIDPSKYLHFIKSYCENEIGVSWDYRIRKTRAGGIDRNEEYERRFWENHRFLLENGIDPFFVITGTKLFFEWATTSNTLINWAKDNNISLIHIERVTKVGNAVNAWNLIGVTNLEHSLYMTRLFSQYRQAKKRNQDIHMSPFDGLLQSVRTMDTESSYGCHSGICDSRFHTFDAHGYKKGCTALNSTREIESSILSIIDPRDTTLNAARVVRTIDCGQCEFKSICSSGCLATDISDGSGECSGGKIVFNTLRSLVEREKSYA